MVRLNKKLWSFNVGCIVSGAFIWLLDFSKSITPPDFIRENQYISHYSYSLFCIALLAVGVTTLLLMIMHNCLHVHSSEQTFWLVLPILSLLILTTIVANNLVMAMLAVAIPALLVILLAARRRKQRRIFDMEKALC